MLDYRHAYEQLLKDNTRLHAQVQELTKQIRYERESFNAYIGKLYAMFDELKPKIITLVKTNCPAILKEIETLFPMRVG